MKKINLFVGAFLFLATSCSGTSKKTIFISNQNEVIVKISANTTENELDSIKTVLRDNRKIDFDFSDSKFNSQGEITVLDYHVEGNGFKAHENAELFMSDEYHGFIRDYRKNSKTPFRCGTL
jgi:hypothetical protein